MKKRLIYIGYLMIVVSLIFVGIELYLRYMLHHPEKYGKDTQKIMHEYYQHENINIIQYQRESAQFDQALFYTLRPGKFEFENLEFNNQFEVNSLGCRDDEASLDYPEMICIGDSYAMGWGVDQNESFPELIEQSLKKKVLNMGISSYGTPREIKFLERVKTDSMKYLIIQHCNNDNAEIENYILHNNKLKVSSENIYDSIVSSFEDRMAYFPFKYTRTFLPRLFSGKEKEKKVNRLQTEKPYVDLFKGFLTVIKNAKNINPDVKIIVFTLGVKTYNNGFLIGVEESLEKEFGSRWHDQISFVDVSDKLKTSDYYILDAHINRKGHQKVANELIKEILKKDSIPEKKWYHDNGSIAIKAEYQNGLKHGECLYYWPNGQMSRKTYFSHGNCVGNIIDFDQKGDTLQIRPCAL